MRKSFFAFVSAIVLILSLLVCFIACQAPTAQEAKVVRISTTTSVNDSGLMAYLAPYFEADTGYKWEIASAGTGAAIKSAKYGNADVILIHSKSSEQAFVDEGFARVVSGYSNERISFMYNYFVLVGPHSDPASTLSADSVKEAFAYIADTGSQFVSRGDESGTHNKEWTLWPQELGITSNKLDVIPDEILFSDDNPDGWYISAAAGMGQCLTMANEKGAYCLTDKATFLSFKNDATGDKLPKLEILFEEDDSLMNTYSMIAVNPQAPFVSSLDGTTLLDANSVAVNTKAADLFINWMTGEHAKALIAFYGTTKYGGNLFYLMDGYLA